MRQHARACVFLCTLSFLIVNAAAQTTIHVPADQPTIQAGIDAAQNGDTVLVSPGTYNERIDFKGKSITVTSSGGAAQTIIDGQQLGSVVYFHNNETNAAVLSGFTIQHGKSDYGGGINIGGAAPIIEHNVIAYNNCATGGGIYVSFSSAVVRYNVIHHNNRDGACYPGGIGGGGIEIGGAGQAQVLYNLIYENMGGYDGGGIGMWAAGQALVEGNIIRNNWSTGSRGGGMNIYNEGNSAVRNNVIVGNHGGGVIAVGNPAEFSNNTVAGNSSDAYTAEFVTYGISRTFRNNLIVSTSGGAALQGYYSGVTITSGTFTYNDVFTVGGAAYVDVAAQTGTNHNISVDPLFANAPAGNFHVGTGSPVIDIADQSITIGSTDVDSNPRIVGGKLDLGGYEYQGQTTMSVPATPLSFSPQKTNTSSGPQTVTVTNTGTLALHVAPIQIGADFQQTNTCEVPDGLPAGQSCTISVVFRPTTAGPKSETLTVAGANVQGPSSTVNLSGTGTAPVVNLSTSSLIFSDQMLYSTSAAQTVTLTNIGDANLALASIAATGDFAQTNNCPSTLAPNAACTISVTFTPTQTKARTGTMTIQNDASGSPHGASLAGNGIGPEIAFSSAALLFTPQSVGTISNPLTLTVTNTGGYDLVISAVQITGDFSIQGGNCVVTLAPGGSCQLSVQFLPTLLGGRFGSLSFTDNAAGAHQTVSLSGQGTAPLLQAQLLASFPTAIYSVTTSQTTALLRNIGSEPLVISSISVTGNSFSQTNNCTAPLAVSSACSVTITFTPTSAGTLSGSLVVTSNAVGSPTTLNFSATALAGYPAPILTSISPSAMAIGSGATTLTVTGTNFYPTTTVLLDGQPVTTTFISSSQLTMKIDSSIAGVYGEHTVAVSTPSPGGGTSAGVSLLAYRAVQLSAHDLVYDRFRRVFYASVAATSLTNLNQVVAIDPATGSVTPLVDLGNEANRLALSDDGHYVYIGVDAASAIKRFDLYASAVDLTIPMGSSPYFGALKAGYIYVLPGSPRSIAVALYRSGVSPAQEKLSIFDDAVSRPTSYSDGYPSYVVSVSDPSVLYISSSGISPSTLTQLKVTSAGLSLLKSQWNSNTDFLVTDGTYIYSYSTVFDPTTLGQIGSFSFNSTPAPTWVSSVYADGGPKRAYFSSIVSATNGYAVGLWGGDTQTHATSGPVLIPLATGYYGSVYNVTRWSSNGLAFRYYAGSISSTNNDEIGFVKTKLVNASTTSNPVPSISSLAPSSIAMRTANTVVTVTGSDFVPGATAYWNGDERSTEYVNSTHLKVFLPVTDFSSNVAASITVVNPPQGGGTSNAVQFGVTTPAPAQLSQASLDFGTRFVWNRPTSSVTITNTGALPLPVASVAASAGFSQTNDCGSAVPALSSCTVSVTFAPSTVGAATGTITIQHDLLTTPSVVNLSGTAVDIVLSLGRTSRSARGDASFGISPKAMPAQVEVVGGALQARISCSAAGTACAVDPASALFQPGITPIEIRLGTSSSKSVQLQIHALGQVRSMTITGATSSAELQQGGARASTSSGSAAALATARVVEHPQPSIAGVIGVADGYSYQKWLQEDVAYIITAEEKARFNALTTDEERDRFVEQFWERRNPDPSSAHNSFKQEHYRRLAYSNQHFAAKVAGWRTDRGRIYIVYGPPESIKDEPATVAAPPVQLWHYKLVPGVAEDTNAKGEATLRFVDECRCNDYRLTMPKP